MQWVHEAIAKYTGVTDSDALAAICDIMADNVRTFGGLSPEQFRREAREAKAVFDYMLSDAGAAYIAQLSNQYV